MAHEQMSARLDGVAYGSGVETTPTLSEHTAALRSACARPHQVEPVASISAALEPRERWLHRHAHERCKHISRGRPHHAARERVAMTSKVVVQAMRRFGPSEGPCGANSARCAVSGAHTCVRWGQANMLGEPPQVDLMMMNQKKRPRVTTPKAVFKSVGLSL